MTTIDQVADPVLATIRILEGSSLILDALGGASNRIAGGEVPKGWVKTMPQAGIVVVPAGGGDRPGSNDTVPVKVPRLDVRCYHATPMRAHRLALAVEDVLRQWKFKTSAGVLVHWFNHAGGPSPYRTEADWPVCVTSFRVQYARSL